MKSLVLNGMKGPLSLAKLARQQARDWKDKAAIKSLTSKYRTGTLGACLVIVGETDIAIEIVIHLFNGNECARVKSISAGFRVRE